MWRCRIALACLVVALVCVVSVNGITDYNGQGLDCWEVCFLDGFQMNSDKEEQKRLQQFLKLVNKVKQIRIQEKVSFWACGKDTRSQGNYWI